VLLAESHLRGTVRAQAIDPAVASEAEIHELHDDALTRHDLQVVWPYKDDVLRLR
jgi:hypothetical protein